MTDDLDAVTLAVAAGGARGAFLLAVLFAVAGFDGGVLLLPVFTRLFALRVAVPMLTTWPGMEPTMSAGAEPVQQ